MRRQSAEANKPGRDQARRRDRQVCSQSAEANKTGRDQAGAGRRANRRRSVTTITSRLLGTKGWDAVHRGKQDELATTRGNTGPKYAHKHTTGEGNQGGAHNQREGRNQRSRKGGNLK